MKWIGLTGGIATGKSSVAKIIRGLGIPIADADEISHSVVGLGTSGLKSVVAHFGLGILLPDGSLDRRKLGSIIFNDEKEKLYLEKLIHPLVQLEVQRLKIEFAHHNHPIAFYDVPLLFEKKLKGFDAVVCVDCDETLQRRRLKERNQLSDEEIDSRLANQLPMEQKRALSDYVIYNNGTIQDLERKVRELLDSLRTKNSN